jgi:hypothetical protein
MAPLVPLVQLVVALPLLMPTPPIHRRLCLLLCFRLSSRPSRASQQAGCCDASCHTDAYHPPAPLQLDAPLPLVTPLLCLSLGWLSRLSTPPITPLHDISDLRPSMPCQSKRPRVHSDQSSRGHVLSASGPPLSHTRMAGYICCPLCQFCPTMKMMVTMIEALAACRVFGEDSLRPGQVVLWVIVVRK